METFIVICTIITAVAMILTAIVDRMTASINKKIEVREQIKMERRLSYIRRASERR